MAYGFMHFDKYSKNALGGIDKHESRRAKKSNTNPNIKYENTHKNYDLVNGQGTYISRAKKVMARYGITNPRKNAVWCCEFFFTASPSFFDKKTPAEIRQFFTECYNWVAKKYGKDKIISAEVHLDEKTPHMHLNFVPIDKNKKLNARGMFNRNLRQLQDDLYKKVFKSKGLERGKPVEETARKHYDPLVYKVASLKLEIEELEKLRDSNEFYKVQDKLRRCQQMLLQMHQVLESNPKLMRQYKLALEELKKARNGNTEELSI